MVVFLIQQVMMADCYPCICVMCSCVLTALLKARGLLLHTAAVIVCGCLTFKLLVQPVPLTHSRLCVDGQLSFSPTQFRRAPFVPEGDGLCWVRGSAGPDERPSSAHRSPPPASSSSGALQPAAAWPPRPQLFSLWSAGGHWRSSHSPPQPPGHSASRRHRGCQRKSVCGLHRGPRQLLWLKSPSPSLSPSLSLLDSLLDVWNSLCG